MSSSRTSETNQLTELRIQESKPGALNTEPPHRPTHPPPNSKSPNPMPTLNLRHRPPTLLWVGGRRSLQSIAHGTSSFFSGPVRVPYKALACHCLPCPCSTSSQNKRFLHEFRSKFASLIRRCGRMQRQAFAAQRRSTMHSIQP